MLLFFFGDALQLHYYALFDGFQAFKTDALDDPLELGEKKKNHTKQD